LTQESGLTAWLTHCHRRCDALWAEVEEAANGSNAALLKIAVSAFVATTRRHLDIEERLIFPQLAEKMPGVAHGPIPVMLAEHDQMKALLGAMDEAARETSTQRVLNLGDTLLMFTQQHNSKEEGMLYPLCEQVLADVWPELHAEMTA
jgi:hemerythrin-like domain-containing protein